MVERLLDTCVAALIVSDCRDESPVHRLQRAVLRVEELLTGYGFVATAKAVGKLRRECGEFSADPPPHKEEDWQPPPFKLPEQCPVQPPAAPGVRIGCHACQGGGYDLLTGEQCKCRPLSAEELTNPPPLRPPTNPIVCPNCLGVPYDANTGWHCTACNSVGASPLRNPRGHYPLPPAELTAPPPPPPPDTCSDCGGQGCLSCLPDDPPPPATKRKAKRKQLLAEDEF